MLSHGIKATRLTVVFMNVIFVGTGVVCMAVGSWILMYRENIRVLKHLDDVTNNLGLLQNAAILIITSGLALFGLGFLGCYVAYQERKCFHVLYQGLVTLVGLVTIAAAVTSLLFRQQVTSQLLTHLSSKLRTEYQGFSLSKVDFSQAFDFMQVEMQCCGVTSHEDFAQAQNWTVRHSAVIPLSCCRLADRNAYLEGRFYMLEDNDCPQFPDPGNSHMNRPCYDELKKWMELEALLIGVVAMATIVIQVLSLLFMTLLSRQLQRTDNSAPYHSSP